MALGLGVKLREEGDTATEGLAKCFTNYCRLGRVKKAHGEVDSITLRGKNTRNKVKGNVKPGSGQARDKIPSSISDES